MNEAPSRNPPRRRLGWPTASLRTYLSLMILVSILPFVGFTVYQTLVNTERDQQRMYDNIGREIKAFEDDVDREFKSTIAMLNMLTYFPPVQQGDFGKLRELLRTQPVLRPNWSGIYLLSRGGAVLFDSAPDAQRSYPDGRDRDEFWRRPATEQAFISNLFGDREHGGFATAIEVPVRVNGEARYLLGARIPVTVWQGLVAASGVPEAGNVALFDRENRFIARYRSPERFFGTLRPADSLKIMAGRSAGSGRLASVDAGASYGAWTTIPRSGWGVGVGMPAAPIDAARQQAIVFALGIAAACLLLGILLAFSVARQMARPLRGLAHNEKIPGRDEPIAVREIALLRDALVAFEAETVAAQERLESKRDLLQKRADEFETLLSSSPIGLAFAQDARCRRITHNAAMDRVFGSPDSHAGGFVEVLHKGRPLPAEKQPLQRAAALGESTRDLELELRFDGRPPAFVIVSAVPLWDSAGRPRGAIGAVVDITERKAAEARLISAEHDLRESQRLIELAQEAGHVGFFHYDVAHDTLAWTPGLAKLFRLADGTPRPSLAAWARFVDSGDLERVERELRRDLAAGEEKGSFDYGVRLADGTALWLSSRIQVLYADDGRPQHIVGVTVDLTEHKNAERERAALTAREQAARVEAESANRAKDVFLAMLSHELRNPLSAVTSAIELLNRIGSQAEAEVNARRILRRQTQHLAHMLDDLLDVARVTSGHLALSRRNIDLAARVQHLVGTLEITGQPNAHQLTLDLNEVWIDADPTRIEQVINNLLNNAIKYTPPGGRIEVRVGGEAGQARLEVRNSGPGIPAELLPRIFDLFVQGERTLDRRDGGLGVGLTLVRRLVELHGGSIHAETNELGTAISVRLPAIAAPAIRVERRVAPPVLRRRIALIEDNEDVLDALHSVLKVDGHTVWTATDGISGLALLLNVRPEVAIVDIGLPGLTGFAVAKRSRAGGFAGKMIALSGYGHVPDLEQALAAGFDAYLLKPIDLEKLQGILAAEVD
jgi:signal transduction histidine kinase